MPTIEELVQEVVKICPIIKKNAIQIDPQALGEIAGYEIGIRVFNRAIQSGTEHNEMVSERHRYGTMFERALANVGRQCARTASKECLGNLKRSAMKVVLDIPIPKKDAEGIIDNMLCLGGLDLLLMWKE